MTSNILSRLLPSADDDTTPLSPTRHDRRRVSSPGRDLEDDEDNFGMAHNFEDQDLEQLLAEGMEDDDVPRHGRIRLPDEHERGGRIGGPSAAAVQDDDDDVPESLLLEDPSVRKKRRKSKSSRQSDPKATPAPGPETQRTRAQWEATRTQQRLHDDYSPRPRPVPAPKLNNAQGQSRTPFILDPKERAMWMWANVDNLDQFLHMVYTYYEDHGIWSMILQRVIGFATAMFVYWLSTFMFFCIDYSKLPGSTKLEEIRVPHCSKNLPFYWMAFSWIFVLYIVFVLLKQIQDLPRLWEMHNFYHYLLGIPDRDIQTVSWQYVVSRLMALRDSNPKTALNITTSNRRFLQTQSKERMDAHDIANRLMRRENYWIAMINKDILDCTLTLPVLGKRSFYTRVLEWGISVCLMDFVFDESGQVRPALRTIRRRKELIEILRNRFRTAGFLALAFSIPLAIISILVRFLRSFTEYQKNPSQLSTRKFSLLAEWKIRDYNEVSHLFHRRKRMAYPYADRYLQQFPKDKMNQAFRFAAFILGSLAAVLGVVTLFDPDLFLGFEISGKTALFWLGLFSSIYMICRSAASDEDDEVWDPEFAMTSVIGYTHYCPDHWKDRLHSDEVRGEFAAMYKLEAGLFFEEILGVFLMPLILLWTLPANADALVDFFREFTIHVDGLGTICSFAEFNFKNDGKTATRPGQRVGGAAAAADLRDDYYGDKNNKLMESYYSFLDHYGPNPRRGAPSSRNRRPFHPPPTWPGMTNQAAAASGMAEHPSTAGGRGYVAGPSALRQSMAAGQQPHPGLGTPRFGPAPGHVSPERSILLDPHHQPRSSPRSRPHKVSTGLGSGTGSSRQHTLDSGPLEADEEEARHRQALPRASSKLIEEDSDLGDSWLLRGGAPEEDAKKSADLPSGAGDGGVLGLLREIGNAPNDRQGHV